MALTLLAVSLPALAVEEAKEAKAVTRVGEVASITGAKLVMTSKNGREYSRALTANLKGYV